MEGEAAAAEEAAVGREGEELETGGMDLGRRNGKEGGGVCGGLPGMAAGVGEDGVAVICEEAGVVAENDAEEGVVAENDVEEGVVAAGA